jgi:hypothetical protein
MGPCCPNGAGERSDDSADHKRRRRRRQERRSAGRQGHSIPRIRSKATCDDEDGYGNAVPMESKKRFPQRLGNLAQNARFPHFHSRSSSYHEEDREDHEHEERRQRPVVTTHWPQASRILGHLGPARIIVANR